MQSVFRSYDNLQNFLLKSDDINQVISQKNRPFPEALPPSPPLTCKWKFCQIVTAPLRWILAIVLKTLFYLTSFVGMTKLATILNVRAYALISGFDRSTRLFRIVNTLNQPTSLAKRLTRHISIQRNTIRDPKLKELAFPKSGIKFNPHGGICRGASEWFTYLYLKTKNHFSKPRAHIAALGKQFAQGGSIDPTIIQAIYLNTGDLLGLKIGIQNSKTPFTHPLLGYSSQQWNSSKTKIFQDLQNIPPGAYTAFLPSHATAYIKISCGLSYFFDANYGVTEIRGPLQGKYLYALITRARCGENRRDYDDLMNRIKQSQEKENFCQNLSFEKDPIEAYAPIRITPVTLN